MTDLQLILSGTGNYCPRTADTAGGAAQEADAPMRDVPYGHCHCGCGEKTNIAPCSRANRSWVKGEPKPYIMGHNRRKSPVEYLVDPGTGCWVWQRGTGSGGYGMARKNGASYVAHRLMFERHKGPIAEGLQLDHLCRNTLCVNPEHLEPVTCAENLRRGVRTKLTAANVREIRQSNATALEIAARFGVSRGTIYSVRQGQTWRDVA